MSSSMTWPTSSQTELKMTKRINSCRRTWRICTICSCHSREKELRMTLCLQRRGLTAHLVLRESKICLGSELIMCLGRTILSKSLQPEWPNWVKTCRKCTTSLIMSTHTTEATTVTPQTICMPRCQTSELFPPKWWSKESKEAEDKDQWLRKW